MTRIAPWILFVVLTGFLCPVVYIVVTHQYAWHKIAPYWDNLAGGWLTTIAVSACALVMSVLAGALLTAGQLSPLRATRWVARVYVELIRGTPLLSQILLGYYLVADQFGLENKFWVGVVLLALFAAGYLSEIFRGGIESIPKSQLLSARAVGFSPAQTYRYVIIPQALRRVLPAISGQFANLIKDSSLLYYIGVMELTQQAIATNSATYATFEAYVVMAAGYLVLTLSLSQVTRALERRFHYEA